MYSTAEPRGFSVITKSLKHFNRFPILFIQNASEESCIQMAIYAYKDQKIKSKKRAAAIFGVPETTFHERLSDINKLLLYTCIFWHNFRARYGQ